MRFWICILTFTACAAGAAPPRPTSAFYFDAAQRFEDSGAWDKAEEQYLKVDKDAPDSDRQKALDGIARVRGEARKQKRSAAEALVEADHAKEADQVYIDLIKTDSDEERKKDRAALEKIAARPWNGRWREWWEEKELKMGIVLLILSALVVACLFIHSVWRAQSGIILLPFSGSTDDTTKKLAFWIGRAKDDLCSSTPSFPLTPRLAFSLPFVVLPGAGADIPEIELEIGGTKLPLKALYELLAKPKKRVSGSWHDSSTTRAMAKVERRVWMKFQPESFVSMPIHPNPGPTQDTQLHFFAYSVFIEASR